MSTRKGPGDPPADAERAVLVRRKDAHLEICLGEDVGSGGPATGLGGYSLEYDALPELDFDDIALETSLFGKTLAAPIVVGAMTGGSERAQRINHTLARAAARVGVGMALGSQRAMVAAPELTASFAVKRVAPELRLLFGNFGAVQLNFGMTLDAIRHALEATACDAVNFHLNPLQEAIQPEGDTRFSGLAEKLGHAARELSLPVLVKEVGAGISARTANKLAALPIAGIEASGTGGTSWAKVESLRAPAASAMAKAGKSLAGFGIPTAQSIVACRKALGTERVVVASGGIRTGMDVAVALALGADACAVARPMLEAAEVGEDAAVAALEALIYELRVICFCTGARTPRELTSVHLLGPR